MKCSFFFTELAAFFHSLPVAFLRPEQLIALTDRYYAQPHIVEAWKANNEAGLSESEQTFIKRYGFADSRILVIGCGQGREFVPLARSGFAVTAIESGDAMFKGADRICREGKLQVTLRHMSLYDLGTMSDSFDLIMPGYNYGMIPSRILRRRFLEDCRKLLKPSGKLYLSLILAPYSKYDRIRYNLYSVIAFLCFGNRHIETGDNILGDGEFHHFFSSVESVIEEARSAGWSVEFSDASSGVLFLSNPAL